jgi:hypothetical protein
MIAILPLLLGCAKSEPVHTYDATLLQLASGYSATMACQCIFMMEQTEEYCREWTRVSPEVARFRIDRDTRTITARSLGFRPVRAVWVDERHGCVVQ